MNQTTFMEKDLVFTGSNENEVWQQLESDLKDKSELVEYHALLVQNNKVVSLDIDYDPGGGFENGSANTSFACVLPDTDYRLAIHPKNFLDDIGKFFGMEDIVIGYPQFDKRFIIKTNNAGKTQKLFSEQNCREILETIDDFTLETIEAETGKAGHKKLLWSIEDAIADPALLRKLYHVFFSLCRDIEMLS